MGYNSKFTSEQVEEKLEEVSALSRKVGDLAELQTDEKSNLVKAINEAATKGGGGEGGGNYDDTLVWEELSKKQDKINDLSAIRSGASKGETAVQPAALNDMETKTHASATYQTKGDYATKDELSGKANKDEIPDISGLASQTEVNQLSLKVGALADLKTTAKENIVEAVNELSSEKQQKITESSKLPWTLIRGTPSIPSEVTESVVSGWGFTKNTGTYSKPSGGIPKSDLASAVQTSLDKADTALQSGALSGYATQTWVTQQKYLTQHQSLANYALKSEIPSLSGYATQTWVEGKKYLTQHQDISGKADKMEITTNSGTAISTAITSANYPKATIVNCEKLTSLTLTSIADLAYEVVFVFSTGTDVTNFLAIPSGTKVINEIKIEASKTYAMSILGGSLVCGTINLSE